MQFEDRFKKEADCREHLLRLRWPNGFICPKCGHGQAWWVERDLYRCVKCDYQASLTAGTIFHGSRTPLMVWFRAMWHVTHARFGISALGLQKELMLGSYHTAWAWMHKLRAAMVRPGRDRLGGIIEVSVMYMGGHRPGKRGRGAEGKNLVVAVVQSEGNRIGRIRLRRIPNASASEREKRVAQEVEPGSPVLTDGWSGFGGLDALGYKHVAIRKGAGRGEPSLAQTAKVAQLMDQWLRKTHQNGVQCAYLDYCLDEFTFRFNRRTWRSRDKLFDALVQQAAMVPPPTRAKNPPAGNSMLIEQAQT